MKHTFRPIAIAGLGLISFLVASGSRGADLQIANAGSVPLPVIVIPVPGEGKDTPLLLRRDGKEIPMDVLDGTWIIDHPLNSFTTVVFTVAEKPWAPQDPKLRPAWLKAVSRGFETVEGEPVLIDRSGLKTVMGALALDEPGAPVEGPSGRVAWTASFPGAGDFRLRCFGGRMGEMAAGGQPAIFRALQTVTIRKASEYNIPRYACKGDALTPGEDWVFIGSRRQMEPDGPGLYLWCKKGKVTFSSDEMTLAPGAVVGFLRAPFSINAYIPHTPILLRPGKMAGTWEGAMDACRVSVLDRNGNGAADFDADLWWVHPREGQGRGLLYAFHPGASGRAEYLWIVAPPENYQISSNIVVQGRVVINQQDLTRMEFREKTFTVGKQTDKCAGVRHLAGFWDWNASGRFLCGHLFAGGHVPEGLVIPEQDRKAFAVLDLDGNGDADVMWWPSGGADQGASRFDFRGRQGAWAKIRFEPAAGRCVYGHVKTADPMAFGSEFRKTLEANRYYQGAAKGFEEHFAYRIDQVDETGEGFIRSPAAMLFLKSTYGNIDRLTMGALGKSSPEMTWNIELDPQEESQEQPPTFRICTFRDPGGRFVSMTSSFLPQTWDGRPLSFKRQASRAVDILPDTPWQHVSKGDYFKLRGLGACFTPEGHHYGCNEGMYGGTIMERIERDVDGATFVLYYSSLMGDLHLKGADIGYYAIPFNWKRAIYNDRDTWHWRSGLESEDPEFLGTEGVFSTLEGKRYIGPVWLYYQDLDGDGYFDTYLYDMENDGLYDRAAWYQAASSNIVFLDGGRFASWPEKATIIDVPYQIESYDRIEELYIKGYDVDPLPVRCHLGSSGMPVEMRRYREGSNGSPMAETPRDLFVTAESEWSPRVMVDTYHGEPEKGTWIDSGPDGLARLGTLFLQYQVVPGMWNQTWDGGKLQDVDVLIISRLRRLPDTRELVALLDWVDRGGTLLLLPPPEEEDRLWFAFLGEKLGFEIGGKRVENQTTRWRMPTSGTFESGRILQNRLPAPGNRVEHYRTSEPAFLEGLKYICFRGYPLTVREGFALLLSYRDVPLVACRPIGKGRVVVSATDLAANRYLIHPEYLETAVDNKRLMERFVQWVVKPVSRFEAIWEHAGNDGWTCRVAGKGGTLSLPRLPLGWQLTVDGSPAVVQPHGIVSRLQLPEGKHRLQAVAPEAVKKSKPAGR